MFGLGVGLNDVAIWQRNVQTSGLTQAGINFPLSLTGVSAGAPGTLPTAWGDGSNSGGTLTRNSVATGTLNGKNYVDLRYAGTTAGAGNLFIVLQTGLVIPALTGQQWTHNEYLALVGGSWTNVSNVGLNIDEFTSANGYITTQIGTIANPTATLTNYSATMTLTGGGTTAFAKPVISINYAGAVAIDFTLRISLP